MHAPFSSLVLLGLGPDSFELPCTSTEYVNDVLHGACSLEQHGVKSIHVPEE